jgi:hypothetical protein
MSGDSKKRPMKISFGMGRKRDRPSKRPALRPAHDPSDRSDAWDVKAPTMPDGSKPPSRSTPYASERTSDGWDVKAPTPTTDSVVSDDQD